MGSCSNCRNKNGVVRMWGTVDWCRPCAMNAGAMGRKALAAHDFGNTAEGYTPAVLKRLAAGPIMDSNALYLPAGKLTMDEYRQREMRLLGGGTGMIRMIRRYLAERRLIAHARANRARQDTPHYRGAETARRNRRAKAVRA